MIQAHVDTCFPHAGSSISILQAHGALYAVRPLAKCDDAQVQALVATTLAEFGVSGENCAAADPELQQLSAYRDRTAGCQFYVVTPLENPNLVLGMGGYEPLKGTHPTEGKVEMAKWYFRSECRGKGLGSKLLQFALKEVQSLGYRYAYMETTPKLLSKGMFLKAGFEPLLEKWGDNGHTHPDITIFMAKQLIS